MSELALQAALQAFAAIGLCDAVYVACPVSSGRRELALMTELSVYDRTRLRIEHGERWRREVLEPNRTAAENVVAAVRRRHPDRSVVNPAQFELEGLTQPDYDQLCEDIIRAHVGRLVLAEGWQFSRGARIEAVLALSLGIDVEDDHGNPLGHDHIRASTEVASELTRAGVPTQVARALLPDLLPVA